jgi:hypothetical protein
MEIVPFEGIKASNIAVKDTANIWVYGIQPNPHKNSIIIFTRQLR